MAVMWQDLLWDIVGFSKALWTGVKRCRTPLAMEAPKASKVSVPRDFEFLAASANDLSRPENPKAQSSETTEIPEP